MMEYALILPFDSDSVEFARGWECGEIWHTLRHLPAEANAYRRMVQATNLEMVLRMTERLGWEIAEIPYDGEPFENMDETLSQWALVELTRDASSADRFVMEADDDL